MSNHTLLERSSVMLQRFCLAILLTFFAPAVLSISRAEVGASQPAAVATARQAPLGWTWNSLFSPVQHLLGDQKAMIRFGSIAFIMALYIIWWRK